VIKYERKKQKNKTKTSFNFILSRNDHEALYYDTCIRIDSFLYSCPASFFSLFSQAQGVRNFIKQLLENISNSPCISMGNEMVTSEIRQFHARFVQNQISPAFARGKLFDFGQNANEIIL